MRVPWNSRARMMVRCGKLKRGYMGIWYGCAGQGVYVRFWRCPGGAFREELVTLMGSDERCLFIGEDKLMAAADAKNRRAKKADIQ